jgi:hypothetical protein
MVPLFALQICSIYDIPFLHITVLVFFKNILRLMYISSTAKIHRGSLKSVYEHNDLHFSAKAKGEQFQYIKLNYFIKLCISNNFNILPCILLVLLYIIYIRLMHGL